MQGLRLTSSKINWIVNDLKVAITNNGIHSNLYLRFARNTPILDYLIIKTFVLVVGFFVVRMSSDS